MPLSEKGVERLQEVAEFIRKDPGGFDMGTWLVKGKNRATHCNTVGCIAGWVVALNRPAAVRTAKTLGTYEIDRGPRLEDKIGSLRRVAASMIGMPDPEYSENYDVSRLFYVNEWPEPLQSRYLKLEQRLENTEQDKNKTTVTRLQRVMANLAVARIKAFIKEHKPASK